MQLEEIECASCIKVIEKALLQLEGVSEARINFAAAKVYVEFNPEQVNDDKLVQAVKDAGYRARVMAKETAEPQVAQGLEKLVFRVEGMECAACAARLEKALAKLKGVQEAGVNFAAGKATVVYNPAWLGLDDLRRAADEVGYRLREEHLEVTGERQEVLELEEKKLLSFRHQFIYAAVPTALVMILMIVQMLITPVPYYLLIIAILSFPVIFMIGFETHKSSWKAIRHGTANMDVLISLGSIPPYLMGLAGFIIPLQSFMEMATTIMTFHLLGRYLEHRARGRASLAIKKLLQLGAKTARLLVEGEPKEVPVEQVKKGDLMLIRPGEKIPTDGEVVSGESAVDESMATGNRFPWIKRKATR